MGFNKHFDLQLDMNPRAVAVLHLLKEDEDKTLEHVIVTTRAWYNGRERGFSLEVQNQNHIGLHRDYLFITCVQHRHSDEIAIDCWRGKPTMNGPHPDLEQDADARELAYKKRVTTESLQLAANHIRSLIVAFIEV